MLGLEANENRHRKNLPELIFRCTVSSIVAVFTQAALFSIPHFFGVFSLLFQLLLSGVVLLIVIIFGQIVRRMLGVRASAPAFVLFHIVFIWAVYVSVIRHAVSLLVKILFNWMLALLLIGFFRMLISDPGLVRGPLNSVEAPVSENALEEGPSNFQEFPSLETSTFLQNSTAEASLSTSRVRYCRTCKTHILGFDHHCPAFGNCIGIKNHALFMVLLIGFILTEAFYALIAYQWTKRNEFRRSSISEVAQSLALSTMLFSLIQVLWQVAFCVWHVYCVCFNIRTDEWMNWRRYPEFHVIVQPGQSLSEKRFRNPYHKGISSNLKEFLQI